MNVFFFTHEIDHHANKIKMKFDVIAAAFII